MIGYTVGGGMGPPGRTFGFAADHVNTIELVTSDGSWVRTAAESDLYWVLCGGKCVVGIVTEFDANLMPAWDRSLLLHEPSLPAIDALLAVGGRDAAFHVPASRRCGMRCSVPRGHGHTAER